MTPLIRKLLITATALALGIGAISSADAYGRGGHWGGRGYWGPGVFWGGIGLGLGIGYIAAQQPSYVVVPSPPVTYYDAPPPVVVAPSQPAPIYYPRNGQSPAQVEADKQECNRWATTQADAMNSASVFQRAVLACMDGRGYTSR